MNIGFQAAAEGKAEMAFWPTAAIAYIVADAGGWINLVLLGLFAFAGANTFILLRNVEKAVEQGQSEVRTRTRVSRAGTTSKTGERIEATLEALWEMFPDRVSSSVVVLFAVLWNFTGGFWLLWEFGKRVSRNPDPSLAAVGLFALPLLYIFVILTVIVWRW